MWRAVAIVVGLFGCNDAVSLEIASDRPVPTAIDAICIGVADTSMAGGHFGRRYPIDALPQSLRLEPGGADAALAWVRADRGGVPVARAEANVSFGDDVALGLPRCVRGASGPAAQVGASAGGGAVRLVASVGQGGVLVVAFAADGTASVIDAAGGALVARDAPAVGNTVTAAIAVDIDGDCDDDLAIATPGGIHLWRRDGDTFADAGAFGAGADALVAGDVDGDGTIDLIGARGGALMLYRNDGSGTFTGDATAIPGAGTSAVSALALGDVDGDGVPDLVAGQAGGSAPLAAWLGAGGGAFAPSAGVVPAVPLDVASLALVDADGDLDLDLAVAVRSAAPRLYVDRDGRLEDQSFVRLPQGVTAATAIAIGGFDDGCEPDAVFAGSAASVIARGKPTGELAEDATIQTGATDAIFADIDDDGDLDALLATPQGVVWLAR